MNKIPQQKHHGETSEINDRLLALFTHYRGMYIKRGERKRAVIFLQTNNGVDQLYSRNEHQQWCNCHELIDNDHVTINEAVCVTRVILEFFL